MKARLTRDICFDTLFVPYWGAAGSANALTSGALDPVSRIPEFKVCAVQIKKIAAPMETSLEPITNSYLNQKKDRNMRESIPKFLNGVFSFVGAGYEKPTLLNGKLTYLVPPDKRTQLIYFRAGNSSDEISMLS